VRKKLKKVVGGSNKPKRKNDKNKPFRASKLPKIRWPEKRNLSAGGTPRKETEE